jgi:hypothetical protein
MRLKILHLFIIAWREISEKEKNIFVNLLTRLTKSGKLTGAGTGRRGVLVKQHYY